jgi:hypothetical protein
MMCANAPVYHANRSDDVERRWWGVDSRAGFPSNRGVRQPKRLVNYIAASTATMIDVVTTIDWIRSRATVVLQ